MFNKQLVDAHIHYVDFTWKTNNIDTKNSSWLKELIYYFDKYEIQRGVIFWLPVQKKWSESELYKPNYYLDDDTYCYYSSLSDIKLANDYLSLNQTEQDRIYPLLCWFNPTDLNAIDYVKYMFEIYGNVFVWIWEVFYRHDDLTFQTIGEKPKFDNKATHELLKFTSMYDLPLLVHSNISSAWQRTYPKYLNEFECMVWMYPRAKIIWAHCWISRWIEINWFIYIINRLMEEYENLYLDFSWVVFDEVINKNDTTLSKWVELTEKFSNRIVIGSDVLGDAFYNLEIINSKYESYVNKLSKNTKENILYKNAKNIYKKRDFHKKISFPNLF